jgi:hypothetical protein
LTGIDARFAIRNAALGRVGAIAQIPCDFGRASVCASAIAAELVAELGIDEAVWDGAAELVVDILRQPAVRAARSVIINQLKSRGAISGDDVKKVWEDAKQAEAAPRSTT